MRAPRGYDRNDKPLHHEFNYYGGLSAYQTTHGKTTLTLLRTSKISVDPSTIEVHPKNSSFAVDAGPLVCYDSLIPEIEITKSYSFDYGAIQTNKLPALTLRRMKIFGHHKDTWDAIDPLSSSTTASILEVTKDDTNEDCTPTNSGTNLYDTGTQPLSTITGAEVFGDYNLTGDADLESTSDVMRSLKDAEHYKVNGNKLKSMTRYLPNVTLTSTRPLHLSYERQRVPVQANFADEDLYYAEHLSLYGVAEQESILNKAITTTGISHIFFNYHVRFNEWNKDFDQRRM